MSEGYRTTNRARLFAGALLGLIAVALSFCPARADDSASEIARKANEILTRRCFQCHGANGAAQKNVFVLDRQRLVQSRILNPGDASSMLLQVIESNAMPAAGQPLTDEEKHALRAWVLAGAPAAPTTSGESRRVFQTEEHLVDLIRTDLLNQSLRSRHFLRYFSLAHLYNAGVPDRELEAYRSALGKLINSLSWQKEITAPTPIDPARTLLRIDLRDYNRTAASWDLLSTAYPYTIAIPGALSVEQISSARQPYIRGDWFAANASVPPLYHDLLGLPGSLSELERMLGVDAARDLREEKRVARAGVRASGVSQNNRVLQRHASLHGAYWKSFDFRSSVDRQNIFENPLNFFAAGNEIIFNLPNGLQGYLVVDGSGRRINEAPVEIVSDRTNPDDPVIRNGRSCMSCHYDGIRPFRDEVRSVIRAQGFGSFDRDKALALYQPQAELDALVERDRERFRVAAQLAAGSTVAAPQDEPVNALSRRFSADLSVEQAAAEVGLEPAVFRELVRRSPRLTALGYSQLVVSGGAIKRSAWETNFDDLAIALGLGIENSRHASRIASGSTRGPGLADSTTGRNVPSRVGRGPISSTSPDSILGAAQTIVIMSDTMFLKPDQLEHELRKRPEFAQMGLTVVKDRTKADLIIDLDRPVFTYIFTYSVSSADSRVVVLSGKVTAFDGNFAAPKIAKALIKRFQVMRPGPSPAQ
jgi:mono/diheme cytochrome c family protein